MKVLDKLFQNEVHIKSVIPDKSDLVTISLCIDLAFAGFLCHKEV